MNYSRIIFPLIIAVILSAAGCKKNSGFRYDEGAAWNTVWHVTYESDADLRDSVVSVLNEVGSSLSFFDSLSNLSAINTNKSDIADTHLQTVFRKSKEIHNLTSGSFDPTVSPLISAWGFGKGHKPTADTLRIDSLLEITGLDKVSLRGNRIVKQRPEITMNFSAIAKGYGADRVGKMLERNGVSNYLVEIGGEIRCAGHSPSRNKWLIGIDRPVEANKDRHDIQETVPLTDCGMATSGNYRNFHKSGVNSLGHTISPVTGRPVISDIASVTVIAPDCMDADALATAFMVLGAEKSKKLAENNKIACMLILRDQSVWKSSAFKNLSK